MQFGGVEKRVAQGQKSADSELDSGEDPKDRKCYMMMNRNSGK